MPNTDRVNILVVDDLPEKLLVLETVLAELGQNIVIARSGQEALRQVLEREFAVILLDVNMPDMDGYETAALIRRRKKSAHIPIIFVTAYADELHRAQGYALGAVDYLLSPIVPEVLRTKVKVFVDLFMMTQQIRRQADERVALAEEQAARSAAEETVRRLNFLAEASKVLASSLEFEVILRGLLRLVVPRQADLGVIALVNDAGRASQTELAWTDPTVGLRTRAAGLEDLRSAFSDVLHRVLQTGEPVYLPEGGTEEPAPEAWTTFSTNGHALPHFALRSGVILPLSARGRTLGALSLGMGPSGRRSGPADLALAEELAGRAAIALDNARLYRDIQEADRRKNEFLSMLAHELRNPLAPLLNGVELLRLSGPSRPDLAEIEDMMERQVKHLVRMVDDLLDISRITRGKIWLRTEPLDVGVIVARAVEVSRPFLDARRHEFTVALPDKPLQVEGDAIRLAQVLTNLLHNASKYTEEGGRIWLSVAHEGKEAVFRIRDTGVGIPAEMLASVFDLFTQVERTLDRSHGGLGIGLTLVRRLVEMHGGSVQVYSSGPGQGSEFTVRLPALLDTEVSVTSVSPMPESVRPVSRRVLVVDDNKAAAQSLSLLLRSAGHEVRTAYDGPAALAMAEGFQPEIALLDIGLPGMDGYEVARHLRLERQADQLMLVALTGYGQDEDRIRTKTAGFDHHVVKPADPAALMTLIAACASASDPEPSQA
jgi:signal transduction histidine kinase/DNA-binding response OmpR family regulator